MTTFNSFIRQWSTTPASNGITPNIVPYGWPEGMAPSAVNDTARQNMTDHREQWQDAEWFDWGHVPTYISATSFSVPTDLTAVYKVGRRIKMLDASTLYGTILTTVFGSVTTVTVTMDSGSLSASLTKIAPSIISPTNTALPILTVLPVGTQFNTKSFTLTSATTINSATFVSTGVVVNITPTNASNTVLVRATINVGFQNNSDVIQLRLYRNSTQIGIGDAAGVRTQGTSSIYAAGSGSTDIYTVNLEFLDSPATTSAVTYGVYALTASPVAFAINRTYVDTNTGALPRTVSTITVCEVKV